MGLYPSSDVLLRNPITGVAGCCARAANGHAAALPSNVMNSRRLMRALVRLRAAHYHAVAKERRCASQQKLRANVADGSNLVSRGWCSLTFEPHRRDVPKSLFGGRLMPSAGILLRPSFLQSIASRARDAFTCQCRVQGGGCQ